MHDKCIALSLYLLHAWTVQSRQKSETSIPLYENKQNALLAAVRKKIENQTNRFYRRCHQLQTIAEQFIVSMGIGTVLFFP